MAPGPTHREPMRTPKNVITHCTPAVSVKIRKNVSTFELFLCELEWPRALGNLRPKEHVAGWAYDVNFFI